MNPLPLFLIIVTLPLLLGGCGEKPVAESNEPNTEAVNFEELEQRESIWYLIGSDTPYTGKVFRFHENGQKMTEGNIKDGKFDGLLHRWRENGQKQYEGNWKDGKGDGLMVRWHENGQKKSEANYKDGKQISKKWWNNKGEPVDTIEEAK